jgi:hypothetical protein
VAESNLNPDQIVKKRRTKRIIQAVPLTVTGVDALGRPFQERTSTVTINCQGCRYQSKHYVLKNMWVTLEIPHNEPGHPTRTVRARVTWIQRPRTVRELFQVAVELEVSGNIWGIAFPPSDWFPFPETGSAPQVEIPAPSETPQPVAEEEDWSTLGELASVQAPGPEPVENNVRVLPLPAGGDESLQLARQVARLVAEAKEQIQSTARQSANEAVATETRMLLADLHTQLMEAAKQSAAAAMAAQIEETQQETLRQRQSEREAALSALREEMARERSLQTGEARQQMDAQLAEVERERQADFELRIQNQLDAATQKLESMTQALGARENEARVTVEQMRLSSEQAATNELRIWQDQMDQRSADAQARLAEMDHAAKSLKEQLAAAAAMGEGGWRGTLDAELESATERWRERTETLIEEAARFAAEKFGKSAEAAGRQIEQQLQQRIAVMGDAHSQATAEAENALGTLRAAISKEAAMGEAVISHFQESLAQLEARRGEFSELLQTVSEECARRGEAMLESQSREMNRQAESAVAGMAQRMQPVLEAAGHDTVERLASELEQRLAPQMARVEEAASKLLFDSEQAEKTLAEHQERVWQASDRNLQDTVTRGKELLAQIETEFGESGREAIARWTSELESKATETTQGTFEALYKSADWYEKKVQNQMQTTLQKGVDQAAAHLREKAAELSGMFAQELDHVSRSYVEHAQGQIQESAADAAERGSRQIMDAGDAAAAKFTERAAQLGNEQFDIYASKTKTAFEQNAAYMEAHTTQIRSKLESDTRGFANEFQRALSQHAQQALTLGVQELASQIDQARESLLSESQTLQRQFGKSVEPLGIAAIDEHKKRLENASNAWLLTTVSKLSQQSESLIAELAEATEKKLKDVCSDVISEMGATLRQRLGGLAAPGTPAAPSSAFNPPERKK